MTVPKALPSKVTVSEDAEFSVKITMSARMTTAETDNENRAALAAEVSFMEFSLGFD